MGVRHQNAIATWQREVGGQGRALVPAFLLGGLDQDDLVALNYFLDFVLFAQNRAGHGARLKISIRQIIGVIVAAALGARAWLAVRVPALIPGTGIAIRRIAIRRIAILDIAATAPIALAGIGSRPIRF